VSQVIVTPSSASAVATVQAPAATSAVVPSRAASAARIAGLDGLRTIAIAAVVIFHLNPAWLPGGFLGVDIFFVVSGFLITTLLVREQARTGTVDFAGFWGRRARRLLPALLLCLPLSIVLARLVQTDLLVGIGREVLGALTFSYNWVQIAAGADYFASTTPQLFTNLWSLAVEEQFYLVWPLTTWLLLRHVPSVRARIAVPLTLGVASALWMGVHFDPDLGATRVYYGTDTHVVGLMLGAALAFWFAGPGRATLAGPRWAAIRRPGTLAAGAVLAGLMWWLDESRSFTFRGGLALATLATVVLVASAVSGGRFSQALDLPAMRWVGERSYGIYLWHWPVILIVNADNPSVPGAPGFLWSRAWCVVVTLALADLSYRFVESPIRRLGWRGAWSRLGTVTIGRGTSVQRGVAAAAAAAVLATLGIVATAPAQTSTQRLIEAQEKAATRTPSMAASPRIVLDAGFTMPKGSQIDAYGDSMMVGSVPALRYYFPGIRIDAKSNRRWSAGLAAIMASGHDIRRGVILSFGTNAGVDETDLRAILNRLGPKRMVVLVNIHLNMARTARDNATLARVAGDYANVIVADWNGALARATGALQPDGIHPSMTGQHVYAATIRQAFADLSERHTGKVVKLKKLPIP